VTAIEFEKLKLKIVTVLKNSKKFNEDFRIKNLNLNEFSEVKVFNTQKFNEKFKTKDFLIFKSYRTFKNLLKSLKFKILTKA
jgi:hypothetical protein